MELVVDTSFQLAQKIGLKRALAVHTEDSLCTAAAEVDPALPAAAAKQAVTMLAQPRPPVNLNTFKRARAGHLPVPAAVHKRPVASNPAQPAERRLAVLRRMWRTMLKNHDRYRRKVQEPRNRRFGRRA